MWYCLLALTETVIMEEIRGLNCEFALAGFLYCRTVSCADVLKFYKFLWLLIDVNVQKFCAEMMSGEEPPESLFMKELRRRGMTPTSLLEEKNRSTNGDDEIKFREEDGGWSYSRRNGVTAGAETNLPDQREISMALNSEGLEVG